MLNVDIIIPWCLLFNQRELIKQTRSDGKQKQNTRVLRDGRGSKDSAVMSLLCDKEVTLNTPAEK